MSAKQEKVFSDAWHRVADVKVTLRHSVKAQRQTFQGKTWVLLKDTLSSDWFRVTLAGYSFLSRLSLQKNVEQVWEELLEAEGEDALTQEEVVHLLGQANLSNLLQFDRATAAESLFDRYKKRRKKEKMALIMGFLAIKIPIFDPDEALNNSKVLIKWLLGPKGIALYSLLLLIGGVSLITSDKPLMGSSSGILAPDNLFLLYIGFFLAKVVHEFGHAMVCKHFGGEVHRLGVMLLLFAPVPYVDASASWGFRHPYQRILVGLGGVLFELSVAAVAAVIWVFTAPGTINALAYNVIFAASVSSILFNLNPLMRFDVYYVLQDFLGIPNLFQRSRDQLKFLAKRFILRIPGSQPAAETRREVLLLPLYGIASISYWVLLMWTIVFFIAEQYLALGVAIAWFLGFVTVLVPLGKFLHYLILSPQLSRYRGRALGISLALLCLGVGLLGGVPMPDRIRVDGVVEAENFRPLYSEAEGTIQKLVSEPNEWVEQGQDLLILENNQLDVEIASLRGQLNQMNAEALRALSGITADLRPIQEQKLVLQKRLAELHRQKEGLVIKAPIAGIWSIEQGNTVSGKWIARGDAIGTIVDPEQWRFVAVLPQTGAFLFRDDVYSGEVRLKGTEGQNREITDINVIPHENGVLPTPALGMMGGGKIAVDPNDPYGVTAAEPFFRIQAPLITPNGKEPKHGMLGVMRLTLSSQPLLFQWERDLRQFLQRRFRV